MNRSNETGRDMRVPDRPGRGTGAGTAMTRILVIALWLAMACVQPRAANAVGSAAGGGQAAPEYDRVVQLIEAEEYSSAIPVLERLHGDEPENADVLNLLGFAHRKLGRLELAFRFYREALAIEPLHLGANEYLGELHLERGELAAAQKRLGVLETACPKGCEERDELADAIAAYRKAQGG